MTRNELERYLGKCVTITLVDNTVIEGTLHKTGEKAFADNPNLSVLLNFYFCIDENNEVVKNTVFRVSHIQKIRCNEKTMTKTMTEVKLKPCPFCGSEDFVLGFRENPNEMRVKCKRCKTLFTIFDTPENAPKLWNRRTYCYQAERAVQDMTAEKAIEVLNKIGEETNIEDTLKNLSNSNTFTALKLAVHALEKQVAKKLKEVTRTSSNKKSRVKAFEHNYNHQNWQDSVPIPEYKECQFTDYKCPICNALIKEGRPEFCWRCGQAFDWSDETEGEK